MGTYRVLHSRKLGNGISQVEGILEIDGAGLPLYSGNTFSHWVSPWYWPRKHSTVQESMVTGDMGYLVEDEDSIQWACQGEEDED